MRPLKAKSLIKDVSQEMDLPADVVEEIVDFYWQEIRRSLATLKHPRIHIVNLGDFTVKHWKLDDKMEQLSKFEESNKLKGLQLINTRFKVAEKLYDLGMMKKMMAVESQRKEFVTLHKKTRNESKEQPDTTVEEPRSNTGGGEE